MFVAERFCIVYILVIEGRLPLLHTSVPKRHVVNSVLNQNFLFVVKKQFQCFVLA